MKTLFKNPFAWLAGIFMCALAAAFVISANPSITPAPHWYADVTTIGSNVKWFGHIGNASSAAFLFSFISTKESPLAIAFSFIATLFFAGLVAKLLIDYGHISNFKASALGLFLVVALGVASFINERAKINEKANILTGAHTNDLLRQIWLNKIMEYFVPANSFMSRSSDETSNVNYNTLNLAEAGIDPEVLIDNIVYPIPMDERADTPLEIVLRRLRTKNTVVRDAEAVQLAYNKLESVVRGHRRSLQITATKLAGYGWSPAANTANTPVLVTDGKNIGSAVVSTAAGNANLLAFTPAWFALAQKACNDMLMPEEGRIMVLCSQHVADIGAVDAVIYKQLTNIAKGTVLNLYGFDIYFSQATPLFDYTTLEKQAFGAVPNGNSVPTSFFYHESEVMRAMGDTTMFYRLRDPEADGDIVGFGQRFVALPYRNKFIGAITSGHV
jgi:hypothetical protein